MHSRTCRPPRSSLLNLSRQRFPSRRSSRSPWSQAASHHPAGAAHQRQDPRIEAQFDKVKGERKLLREELERFDDSRSRLALARGAERYLGRLASIRFEPLKSDDRRPLPADRPVANAAGSDAQELTGLSKWYANPVVKTVVEAFNGEISEIRE